MSIGDQAQKSKLWMFEESEQSPVREEKIFIFDTSKKWFVSKSLFCMLEWGVHVCLKHIQAYQAYT